MKHSEMMVLASVIFFARAIHKGVAAVLSIALGAISMFLSIHGN
jgi:hypothetical protein